MYELLFTTYRLLKEKMKRSEPRPPGEGLAYKYVLSSSAAAVAESGRKKTQTVLNKTEFI